MSSARATYRPASELVLERFLPYRLSTLSNRISRAIAGAYERRFNLTVPEWRVIAVLGRAGTLSARDIAEATQMDKVAISRAVARLERAGRVRGETDAADARRLLLRLTARGAELHARIAPLALSYEQALLAALAPTERRALDAILDKLAVAAQRIEAPLADAP